MAATTSETLVHPPSFAWSFFGKVMLLVATIPIVWAIYISLHVYHLDWLGWFYAKLLPATNGLYWLVETYFPGDVKYRVRGAISEDFGQRSLFLLLLTAVTELTLYALFKFLKAMIPRLFKGQVRDAVPR
jgi:hypothetical protein